MRQAEIKKLAENFCTENGIAEYPVEIVKICNKHGLKVYEEYLKDNVSGLIIVDEKTWPKYDSDKFIIVNLADSAMRRRFTIAHELAHFILHRRDSRLYAHRDIMDDGRSTSSIEKEANYFAANVLMPEELVRSKVEDIKNDVWGKVPSFILTKEIADCFVVSESAAEVRLRQLGIV